MNLENMKKLRDQLSRLPPENFRMETWIHHAEESSCGTVACIAGWCSILNGGPADLCDLNHPDRSPERFAKRWLELDIWRAECLFLGAWADKPMDKVTRDEAVAQLDWMIFSEEVTRAKTEAREMEVELEPA